MTKQRYYYEPMVAMIMAYLHGMRFIDVNGYEAEDSHVIYDLSFCQVEGDCVERWYIHPDCEYLLYAQDGDWVEHDGPVVVRNGLPFHWPKTEVISDD